MALPKWLEDDMAFTAEERELADKLLTDDRLKKLSDNQLRQSEFSRKMNEEQAKITKAQADLQAANDRINAELAEFATLKAGDEQARKELQGRLEAAEQVALKREQKLRAVASQYGLDAEQLVADSGSLPAKKVEEPPKVDLTPFARTEQLHGLAEMALTLPATLNALDREHRKITGDDLDQLAIVNEIKTRATTKGNTKSLDPRVVWEELHDIPAKRHAAEEKRFNDAVQAARLEGRNEGLSERELPGAQPPGRHSPVFTTRPSTGPVMKRPSMPGNTNALAALRTGKYREKTTA